MAEIDSRGLLSLLEELTSFPFLRLHLQEACVFSTNMRKRPYIYQHLRKQGFHFH